MDFCGSFIKQAGFTVLLVPGSLIRFCRFRFCQSRFPVFAGIVFLVNIANLQEIKPKHLLCERSCHNICEYRAVKKDNKPQGRRWFITDIRAGGNWSPNETVLPSSASYKGVSIPKGCLPIHTNCPFLNRFLHLRSMPYDLSYLCLPSIF